MQNKKGSMAVVTVIILIVAITAGVIGYLFARKTAAPVTPQPATSKPANQVSTPVVDETANWQTYRNEKYGFEVKYPTDWKVNNIQDGVVSLTKDNLLRNTIDINISKNSDNKSLAEFIDKEVVNLQIQKNPTDVVLGGMQAKKAKDNGMLTYDGVYALNNGYIYHLNIPEDSSYLNIFNQILSTFKFTDLSETANWQTYRNEKYGFEVKYPTDWRFVEVQDGGAMFGPKSIMEDAFFGINIVSEVPKLGTKSSNSEITKVDNDSFVGFSAKKVYTKNLTSGMEWANLYIEKNGNIFSIGQPSLRSLYPESKYDNVIKQILSTFKFTK